MRAPITTNSAIDPSRLLLWQMLFSLPIYFLGSALMGEPAYRLSLPGLLALLYHWETVRDPEHWMMGTLRRQCLMYWRRHRRRIYSAVDSALLELLSQPVSPSQVREEMLADLIELIDRLPPRCRSLLDLRFRLGYEPDEVASLMGYRQSSIGKVTNRCLAALSRQLLLAPLVDRTSSAGER